MPSPLTFLSPATAGHRRDGRRWRWPPAPRGRKSRASGCTSASPVCWCMRSTWAASSPPSSTACRRASRRWWSACSRCSPPGAGGCWVKRCWPRSGPGWCWALSASGWWWPTRWPRPPARRNSPQCSPGLAGPARHHRRHAVSKALLPGLRSAHRLGHPVCALPHVSALRLPARPKPWSSNGAASSCSPWAGWCWCCRWAPSACSTC
jgi:hypothetical protein